MYSCVHKPQSGRVVIVTCEWTDSSSKSHAPDPQKNASQITRLWLQKNL